MAKPIWWDVDVTYKHNKKTGAGETLMVRATTIRKAIASAIAFCRRRGDPQASATSAAQSYIVHVVE